MDRPKALKYYHNMGYFLRLKKLSHLNNLL